MIDVHSHLTDPSFVDLPEVIERAKESGVKKVITSIIDPDDLERAKNIVAENLGFVFLTIGFNPACLIEEKFRLYVSSLSSEKIVGIGEVGLDHFYVRDGAQRAAQELMFRKSINMAASKGLPLVIHSRSAGKKALEILDSEGAEHVLMHAFDGKAGDALNAARKGFFFSIPTSVVHSDQKQRLVRLLPLNAMMLETDSPVLAPVRGERNEPANIIFGARKIAEIKKAPLEEVMAATQYNAEHLFRI